MATAPAIRVRVAAAIVENGCVLLVRHLKDGREHLLLPGGGVEPGETLLDALVRELVEETGFVIRVGSLLFTAESIPPDAHRHILHVCFRVERIPSPTPTAAHVPDDPRIVGMVWLPLGDLGSAPLHPPFGVEIADLLASENIAPAHLGNRWV